MKNCAFIGLEDKICEVYGEEKISSMKAEGMNTDRVLTREMLESSPNLAADIKYIFSTWGMPAFSEEEIERYFPCLEAVFYAAGSVQGFAKSFLNKGIKVFSAWAANAVPVAEYTVAQIILANKGYFSSSVIYKETKDKSLASNIAKSFTGNYNANVGIIGAGMIGKMVIEGLKAYKLNIFVFDPFLPDDKAQELGIKKCSLEELFANCHTISNHLANNPQTVGIINSCVLDLMKDNAVFINTGRGAQVVEEDLIKALREKPQRTAILDVTDPEPPLENSELYTLPNVILTPHIAGSFGNELVRMAEYMLDEYKALKNGEKNKYEVTLEMLKTMA